MKDDFSARLAVAIARSGKFKGDLASHCGVALSTVSRWLKGAQPKPATLAQIAEFLGVDLFWLIGEPGQKREALYQIETLLHAVGNQMRSDAVTSEMERLNRELAMETTGEFLARMKKFTEVAEAFMGNCRCLCAAIKTAASDEPIPAELQTMASELWIHWPEMNGLIHDLLSESAILRGLAESSPDMMKILRSV